MTKRELEITHKILEEYMKKALKALNDDSLTYPARAGKAEALLEIGLDKVDKKDISDYGI